MYAYIRVLFDDDEMGNPELQRAAITHFAKAHYLTIDRWFEEELVQLPHERRVLYEMIGHMQVHGVNTIVTCCPRAQFETWKEAPDLAPLIALGFGITLIDADAYMYGYDTVHYRQIIRELIELKAIYDEHKAYMQLKGRKQ